MTSSPLTAALLGLDTDTDSKDPRYGPSRRKLGLAASLYKTASDTSPTTPMGGLARALTAIPGAFLSYYGNQEADDLTSKYKSGADDLIRTMRETPVASLGSSMPPQTQEAPPPSPPSGGSQTASVTMPPEYQTFYDEASKRTGIPAEVLIAQHRQESGFNPGATGSAGEIGIGQILPATARDPGYGMTGLPNPDVLRDPQTNINFAADYLKARGGAGVDWTDPAARDKALAAYNGGGDANYAAHVAQYLPGRGVAARTGGTDVAGPGGPLGDGAAPPSQQSTGQQASVSVPERAQSAMAMILRAQAALTGIDPHNPYYPQVKAAAEAQIEQGKLLLGISQQEQTRADTKQVREDTRKQHLEDIAETRRLADANRVPQTVTMADPGGKGIGIYERTNTGIGQRLGDAPKQPGESGGPFAGTGMDAQANNVLLSLGPKIKDGSASETERGQYALAYEHLSQGRIMPVPDPTDPTGQRQVLARIPGAVPGQFPAPGAPAAAPSGSEPGAAPAAGPGGMTVIPGTAKPAVTTDTEKVAAGYAVRMREASKTLNDLEGKGVHTGNTGQAALGGLPVVGNFLTSPDYQVYHQQMADWVRAKLRRESGAVIGKDEMTEEIRTYFPEPGDSPEKIAAKRRSRENAQLGMEESGGRAKIEAPTTSSASGGIPAPPPGFKVIP